MRKTIDELKEYTFIIPDYQRAYRWTKQEVEDLLNDLDEFDAQGNQSYCLQPLILKKLDANKFEVVDGQQRLTTIFLIGEFYKSQFEDPEIFKLEYANRENTQKFLTSLNSYKDECVDNNEEIDHYYLSQAYNTIQNWFKDKKKNSTIRKKLIEIDDKLKNKTFFIFYEIPNGQSPEEIYSKINNGKIRLTNAELIKSVLMASETSTTEPNRLQTEISLKWDQIEQELQDNNFWHFIRGAKNYEPRIDLLFEVLARSYLQNSDYKSILEHINEDDDRYVFFTIHTIIKQSLDHEKAIKSIWAELIKIYTKLKSWYLDLSKYHIIGYLLASNTCDIMKIFNIASKNTKSETRKLLINLIKEDLNLKTAQSIDGIRNLIYTIDREKKKIRKILLLFNIVSILKNNDQQLRFSFEFYHKGEWDIEHIHATADKSKEPDGTFPNLTLLNREINRDYKNKPFGDKRDKILEYEKEGVFIPICTKNVFLKLYTPSADVKKLNMWEDIDKEHYIQAIINALTEFLGV